METLPMPSNDWDDAINLGESFTKIGYEFTYTSLLKTILKLYFVEDAVAGFVTPVGLVNG
jgi:hypothetical protein